MTAAPSARPSEADVGPALWGGPNGLVERDHRRPAAVAWLGRLFTIATRKDILTVVPEDDPLRRLTPTLADTWQLAPVCWKTLDREAAARELVALAGWVRWLATRYVLSPRTIPPCWSNHGRMVEELSALRTGWLAAFAPDARLDAPLHWHHDFDATRSRLNETVSWSGCTKDEHRGDDTARRLTIPDTGFAPQATRTWPT